LYEHILIPTDGSSVAEVGVKQGLDIAKKYGSKVTAVIVTEPLGGQFAYASELWAPSDAEVAAYDDAQEKMAQKVLGAVKDRAIAMNLPVETVHIPWKLPARAIVGLADEKGCSLIVMSSHGRTGLNRIMLGSQTAEVLSTAKIPVLVAR